MADTSVVDLNADFVGLWWGYLDLFDAEVLASFPGNGGLVQMSLRFFRAGPFARTLQVIVYRKLC